jgi:hypothetical protein
MQTHLRGTAWPPNSARAETLRRLTCKGVDVARAEKEGSLSAALERRFLP